MGSQNIVGIDLGTTNSLCAVFREGVPELVSNAEGEYLTPSIVGILDDSSVLVGRAAQELRVISPQNTVACFKRWMGTNRTTSLNGKEFNAIQLSSCVLSSLKQDAEAFIGDVVSEAVISVPAYFNENQRQATKLAADMAGLKVLRIINEPTAAALCYGFNEKDADKKVLVFDLGGGTFDVTIMEIFEGSLEIIASAGESFLGGEDFTDAMMGFVLGNIGLQLEACELQSPKMISRLRQECERAKRESGHIERIEIKIPNEEGYLGEDSKIVYVSVLEYQQQTEALTKRLNKPLDRALRDSQLSIEDVDDIILVGGATRMPLIKSFIKSRFGKSPICDHDPDKVVALGAAIQTALITDDSSVDDMVMTDVCPFTLGIEVSKEIGHELRGGYYMPIIHRNTTIPVSIEEPISTLHPNQSHVRIRVYQGESRKTDDNLLLGDLRVDGIPPGPAGQVVFVRFTYDLNGLLQVEAQIHETGKIFQTILTNHVKGLSEEDIKKAEKALETIKFYPRKDRRHKHLLLFAERVIGEVGTYQRAAIEEAVDDFEQVMHLGDRQQFDAAREHLLMTLSSLGFPYNDPDV